MYLDIGDTDNISVTEMTLDNMYNRYNDINKSLKINQDI